MKINFDSSRSFLDVNPHYRVIFTTPLSDYYMWSIAYLEHPDSPFAQFSDKERIDATTLMYPLLTTLIADEQFISDRQLFSRTSLNRKQKFLKNWESKLEERDAFIASIPYNENTYEMMDKMMSASDKLWKLYRTALKEAEEETLSTIQGDQVESLNEQGLI